MSTVEKAMELLNHFSLDRPEIGLSEFHRLLKRDKATTFRHLKALQNVGLLEQDEETQRYRIGPAVLRLAHQREITMPRRAGVRAVLPQLAAATGETAHASLFEGAQLLTLAHHEASLHSNRVVMNDAILPLHATGSGHVVLAFGDDNLRKLAISKMTRFTEHTVVSEEQLAIQLESTRRTGFGVSIEGYESGVHGIAAPLFDHSGKVAGSVAVACVASRMTPELESTIKQELVSAATRITRSWGGTIPDALEHAWGDLGKDARSSRN
ncbi:MAG: IclR family transcriptional regulator [Nitratireductor sp.]